MHIYTNLVVFGLAVKNDISCGVDLCSSFIGSSKLAQEICVNISFLSSCYYWNYCSYSDYFAGKFSAWDIGLDRFSAAQGPFLTVQLFGAWSHQVQWCAAGLLQPVSCEAVLWQSLPGPCLIKPPGLDHGAFVVSPDSVWYARVLLLFSATSPWQTGSKTFDCALVSTLETYDCPENGNVIIVDIDIIFIGVVLLHLLYLLHLL